MKELPYGTLGDFRIHVRCSLCGTEHDDQVNCFAEWTGVFCTKCKKITPQKVLTAVDDSVSTLDKWFT